MISRMMTFALAFTSTLTKIQPITRTVQHVRKNTVHQCFGVIFVYFNAISQIFDHTIM